MEKVRKIVREIKRNRSKCLVVTCIPCDTPYPNKEAPHGCASCGMLDWLGAFETEKECNAAYKETYSEEFDENGKYIKQ